MKVIKDNCAREVTCPHCGSILEVNTKMDIFELDGSSYLPRLHYFWCPCCGAQFYKEGG